MALALLELERRRRRLAGDDTPPVLVPDPDGLAVLSGGGSGLKNGSSWDNALDYDTLTFQRGKVYYLSDGDFNSRTLGTAEASSTYITLRKATTTNPGVVNGWDPLLGNGQAVFNGGMVIDSGYWDLDGAVGGGPTGWRTGHGFKVLPTDGNNGAFVASFGGSPTLHGIRIQRTHVHGPDGPGDTGTDNGKPVGVYGENFNDGLISDCLFDGMGSNAFRGNGLNNIFQRTCFSFFKNTVNNHGEQINAFGGVNGVANWIIRHCLCNYSAGTGAFIFGHDDGGPGGVKCHGTVFAPHGTDTLTGGNGLLGVVSAQILKDAIFYHNTVISSLCPIIGDLQGGDDNGAVRNNLFYDCANFGGAAAFTCTHNHFASSGAGIGTNATTSSGDPFVDWANDNFRLTANTTPGVDLGVEYGTDYLGRARTTHTRGALEY